MGRRSIEVQNMGRRSIEVHAWLMYATFGCLMPAGVIIARFMQLARKRYGPTHPVTCRLFYAHQVLQGMAMAVVIAGGTFSFVKFGLNTKHTHERLGLSLWALVLAQALTSLYRPGIGAQWRVQWYMMHWVFGTGAIILGIYNIYVGMKGWEIRTKESILPLNIAFSIQVAIMAALYLILGRIENLLIQASGLPQDLGTSSALVHSKYFI